uniref:Uncharacterized protein n=1 Tax=Anopheles culicifacies TaxID=139723 RepID=A0A182MHW4_9DIPT
MTARFGQLCAEVTITDNNTGKRPIAGTYLHGYAFAICVNYTSRNFSRCDSSQTARKITRMNLLANDLHHQNISMQISQINLEDRTSQLINGFSDPSRTNMIIFQLWQDFVQCTQSGSSKKSYLPHSSSQRFP